MKMTHTKLYRTVLYWNVDALNILSHSNSLSIFTSTLSAFSFAAGQSDEGHCLCDKASAVGGHGYCITQLKCERSEWWRGYTCLRSRSSVYIHTYIDEWVNLCLVTVRGETHHSLDCKVGESFWAMWYKALIAFMLKRGGLRSAGKKNWGVRNWQMCWNSQTENVRHVCLWMSHSVISSQFN